MNQSGRAAYFRQLHTERPLILPNAWDSASARIIELAGAKAIATTSAGVSWTYGRRDGQAIRREQMLQTIRQIVEAVDIPVSADVESGYGSGSPDDVAETVRALIGIGAVGINLEDSPGGHGETLLTSDAQVDRIQAARHAASNEHGDIVINARIDVFMFQAGAAETRLDETVRRANAYRAAGADCLFVPGVIDGATISALVRAIDGPVNIMAGHGAPSAHELGKLGVARVSVGPAITLAALGATHRAAVELLERGTYGAPDDSIAFTEANGMFASA